jgi:hypothetical protein
MAQGIYNNFDYSALVGFIIIQRGIVKDFISFYSLRGVRHLIFSTSMILSQRRQQETLNVSGSFIIQIGISIALYGECVLESGGWIIGQEESSEVETIIITPMLQ